MNTPTKLTPVQRWLLRAAYLLASVLGLKYGYDFGNRISGMGIGVLLALNCAVFCWMMVGALADRLLSWRSASQRPR